MNDTQILWDLPDDPNGNYRRIIDGHDVTIEEVEEILLDAETIGRLVEVAAIPLRSVGPRQASTSR